MMNPIPTITYGDILSVVSFVVAAVIAYGKFTARMAVMETKVNALWTHFIHPERE